MNVAGKLAAVAEELKQPGPARRIARSESARVAFGG